MGSGASPGFTAQATMTDIIGMSFILIYIQGDRTYPVLHVPTVDDLERVLTPSHSLLESCHHHEVPTVSSLVFFSLLGNAFPTGSLSF